MPNPCARHKYYTNGVTHHLEWRRVARNAGKTAHRVLEDGPLAHRVQQRRAPGSLVHRGSMAIALTIICNVAQDDQSAMTAGLPVWPMFRCPKCERAIAFWARDLVLIC
jgi:hypothetical protein